MRILHSNPPYGGGTEEFWGSCDSLPAYPSSTIDGMDRAATTAGVREAARGLELLDDDGGLKPLDSLNVLDMVVELERLLEIEIPASAIRMKHFESVDTVCTWLEQLAQ